MNCLKGGILFADAVVVPGERYVCEAQTPEYGYGWRMSFASTSTSSTAFLP
jgi:glycogen synthase